MSWRLNLSLTALVIGAAAAALVTHHRAQTKLREENASLREQMTLLLAENHSLSESVARSQNEAREPHLAAPEFPVVGETPSATKDTQGTNFFARFANDPPKLTAEQAEAYLKANGRKASTLLAAYRTSGDAALLEEAMQNHSGDPRVAFEAAFKKDVSPEQRRQWLNTFEQTAPSNALPNYLSALDYFKAGQTSQALQELTAAAAKSGFQDYTLERRQDDEEAYLAAGYTVGAAKMLGSGQVTLPQLSQLKQLGLQMVELSNSYRSAGDGASAQAVLEMAVRLGQSYGPGDCAISHLVGVSIERNALSAMDPGSPYGDGQTVEARLNQLTEQKSAIRSLFEQGNRLLQTMSEQDWISYIDRDKFYGEEAAMRWAVSKFGQK